MPYAFQKLLFEVNLVLITNRSLIIDSKTANKAIWV